MKKKLCIAVTALFVLFAGCLAAGLPGVGMRVYAAEAENLNARVTVTPSYGTLTDGREDAAVNLPAGTVLTVSSETPIGGLYLVFDTAVEWTLGTGTGSEARGQDGFLHEYVKTGGEKTLTLTFPAGAELCEITVLSEGTLPDGIQVWKKNDAPCDLLLISTHADDEQLFFAGVLPWYAGECDYEVQVAYFTNHRAWEKKRQHEQLNGLWTVGVTRYPVFGDLPDYWDGATKTLQFGYDTSAWNGFSKEKLVGFQVGLLRRFQPLVVVGQDVNGEYGHPQHQVNVDTLRQALEISADASKYPESAAEYGTWDVPKAYLHLWEEHAITMDWDRPIAKFGGKTAYQMTKLGYACHASQQYTWFTRWLNGDDGSFTSATQITTYSPCRWGLFRTLVGYDEAGGDFFEHLTARGKTPPETEPETEPVTEPETEPVTEPVTERVTEPETVPETEPVTEPATEPVTDPATEHGTEPETAPVTGPAGEETAVPGTESADRETGPGSRETEPGGGASRGAAFFLFLLSALLIVGGIFLFLKKK